MACKVTPLNTTPLSLKSLAVRVTALEKAASENHEGHGAMYTGIGAIEKGDAILDTNLANIWKVLNEIQADLKDLKEKPTKRWDLIVSETIKWAVVAALGALVALK